MKLLDWFGRKTSLSTEPQTASPQTALLHREFAGHPSRGLTPAQLAALLAAAEEGDLAGQAELAEDMEEKDAHLHAELQKRKRTLLQLPWDIAPPANASAAEQRQAADVRDWIGALADLEDVLLDMLDAVLKGYAALEYKWQRQGDTWLPTRLVHRPPSWFCMDAATRTELRLRSTGMVDGEPLQPFGWLVHVHRAKSGYLARAALARILAWPFLFKNYAVRDLAELLEIYGLPLRIGKYPVSASEDDRTKLLRAVVDMGHNAAGIMPQEMTVDFIEASRATSDPFMAMITWADAAMSKAILGGTLTTTASATGLGSSLADVQNECRWDLVKADAQQLGGTLTRQLVYPLLALNHGLTDPQRCPRWAFDTSETEDLTAYADALPKLVAIGLQVPVTWAQERLGIPIPEQGEAVLRATATATTLPAAKPEDEEDEEDEDEDEDEVSTATAPTSTAAARQRAVAAARAVPASARVATDALDAQVSEALGDWEPQMAPIVDPVRRAVTQAATYEELLAVLAALLTEMDSSQLVGVLASALFKARGMGDATDDLDGNG